MNWIDTEISNDYAQFVVAQSLAETSYFEEANEVCYRAMGVNSEQSENLFKTHVLMNPEQRATYAKVIQSMNDQVSQTRKAENDMTVEETRKALFYLAEVKVNSTKTKDALIKAYKEKEIVGEKTDEASQNMINYLDAILKTRAYDLLWHDQKVEKIDVIAAIVKHADQEAIKNLLTQIQQE